MKIIECIKLFTLEIDPLKAYEFEANNKKSKKMGCHVALHLSPVAEII